MAKFLRLCCFATAFLLLAASYSAHAQVIHAPLEQYTSPVLGQQFTQYQVFKLDAKAMDTQFKSNTEAPLQLQVGAHNWRLHLTPSRILSNNYMLKVETPQGIVTTYPKHNIAFKGYEYNSGGRVRITLNGEHFAGFVESGGERYYIEPLWYFEPLAPRDLFVLYPKSAVVPHSGNPCGVTEEDEKLFKLEQSLNHTEPSYSTESGCYEVELAIASDHLMFNKYGSVANVENHNVNVINNVENDYTGSFNHDLDFVIVTQFVSTSAPGPWTASTDAGTLLSSFRTWGNAGNFGVNFDVGELWTNRNFDGSTIGIAYLNGVCNSNKYHCLQDFTNNSELLRCLTSHEIGHNFSATHDANCPPPNLIMCPAVSTANEWSQQSVNQISGYITNRINAGCLTACGPPPPPLVAAFDWSPNPGCVNQAVSFQDQSTGIITSYSWVFPGGTPPTSTQQNPSVTWGTAGTKNVTLTINGVGGSSSLTLPVEINPLPVANFTYTVNGLVVTFTSTSQHGISYFWEFGDGFESSEQNPVHEYNEPGYYVVKLTVTNACGSSVKTSVVNTAPIANFSASPTSGCAALVVQMMNESSSNATSFSWSFPGGAPVASNLANPTVVYSIPGTYTITLTATNVSGSHTFTRTNYITVNAAPVANFTSSTNGNTVTFTNTSLYSPTSYSWAFGDGNTSTAANPVHTYAAPGTYQVVLTATNQCGNSTKTQTIVIESSGAPVAAFTANPSSGCTPLTVNFTNNSVSAVSYQWSFPGGSPDNSTEVSPTVVYATPGTYTATLIATNANGSDTTSATVTVNTVPTSGFTYLVQNDTTYYFTNNSTGASSYQWDFGDGNTSTDENPVHNYPAIDSVVTYTVVLTSINDCGTTTSTQDVSVVIPPKAGFTATPTSGCAPLTVQFTSTSSPNASSFKWLFPGGTPDTSIVANPTVVYNSPGSYSVTLIVSNAAGRDTSIRTNYIVVGTVPTASFTSAANGLTVAFTNTSAGATEYSWDFGDNSSGSTEPNPTHEYAADGTYTVVLTATNSCGTVTSTQSVTVATAPTAGFTASANTGCAPLTVQFTNTSSSNASSFDWDFPGGIPSGSNAHTPPPVVYEVPGTYTVTLTVANAAGTSSYTQTVVVSGGPNANFSSNVSGLDVQFTNSSSNATSYSWDFGDGNGSNEADPSHTYAADGNYTVVLTVSNDCGSSTFSQNIVISTAPDAGFSANTTSGCAVLTVNFTDISDGAPVSWAWSFPGGVPATSNVQSPTVQYFIPGTYDVTLVVTSSGGSTSSFTQPNYITVYGPPTASFTSSTSGNTVSFSNGSVDATSYVWNFGDGSSSASENPTHVYGEDGVYTVTLTATNNCGSSIYEQTVTVATPPTASFTQSQTSGCAPFTVQFNSTSSANATSLAWSFPGGSPASSSEPDPVVTWNSAGTYVVTLTASNAAGTSTSTVTINVNDVPSVGFTHTVSGPVVAFTNTTGNATSYVWDFGDGSDASSEANPSHTYAQAGTYTVTLTAENECGTATFTQTVEVVGSAPTAAISANADEGCAPFTVKFTDLSSGSPNAWNWSFPGGSPASSNEQNPQVTYNAPGVYDVTLEVSNAFGASSTTFPAYINVQGPPSASFSAAANQTTVAFTNNSQGATSYEWNFGDGNTSTEASPTHTYASAGTYNVSLVATNNCGSSIMEQTIVLTSGTGEAAWVDNFRLFPNPNTGAFMVEMTGTPQKEVEFVLFNSLGQYIKRDRLDFGAGVLSHRFDYGDLAAGFYTLRVQGSNGQAIHLKVTVGR